MVLFVLAEIPTNNLYRYSKFTAGRDTHTTRPDRPPRTENARQKLEAGRRGPACMEPFTQTSDKTTSAEFGNVEPALLVTGAGVLTCCCSSHVGGLR